MEVMSGRNPQPDGTPLSLPRLEAYSFLLDEAEGVAGNAVGRLRRLGDRYPSDVPAPLIDALERAHTNPSDERRRGVRLGGSLTPAEVRADPTPMAPAQVVDRSAGGLRLRVSRPLPVGFVVGVRVTADGRWFPVQVRYCRPDGDGWVAGCEYMAERPKI